MTADWLADLQAVLGWTDADERFLDRAGANLGSDERAAIDALVATRGDLGALARRLGPIGIGKLRARVGRTGPTGARAADAWRSLEAPLTASWPAPQGIAADRLATAFLERYAARLDELTGAATKAAAAARSAASAMHALAGSKELVDAASSVRSAVAELQAAASGCTHPEGERASWASHAGALAHEGIGAVDAVRTIRARATELAARCESLARALSSWAEAPAAERATTAEAMASRVRAAAQAAAAMHEQFLGAVFARG